MHTSRGITPEDLPRYRALDGVVATARIFAGVQNRSGKLDVCLINMAKCVRASEGGVDSSTRPFSWITIIPIVILVARSYHLDFP